MVDTGATGDFIDQNFVAQAKLLAHKLSQLTPDASPKSCKVYPLSASEQKELDAFLKENLESGQI